MSDQAAEAQGGRGAAAGTGTGPGITVPGPAARTSPTRNPRSEPPPAPSLSPQEEQDALEAAFQAENTIEARHATYLDDSSSEFSSDSSESGYGSGASSVRSTSLSSSVRDYAFENGRRYHRYRDGRYQFPNDEQEQEREHMKHIMMLVLMGNKLHFAPISSTPSQMIDLGTGTGTWAIEMAEKYTSGIVTGIDLSPIQPEWVPPNAKFLVDDAESPWIDPPDFFDLVHARHTVQAFLSYRAVIMQAFHHIKPGGWIELHELDYVCHCDDGTQPETYKFAELMNYIREALYIMRIDFFGAVKLSGYMREAGFVNVTERILKLPIGGWPQNPLLRKAGEYYQAVVLDGLQGIAMRPLTKLLNWSPESVEVYLPSVRKDIKDPAIHSYMKMYVVYAQKPMVHGGED